MELFHKVKFLALFEQGQITNNDGVIDNVKSGRMSGGSALLEKLNPERLPLR